MNQLFFGHNQNKSQGEFSHTITITQGVSSSFYINGMFPDNIDVNIDYGDGNIIDYSNTTSYSHSYTVIKEHTILINTNESVFHFDTQYQKITSFDIGANDLMSYISLPNNSLSSESVNNILIILDNNGLSNGTLKLNGQAPSASPSGAGLTAKNNLIAKGWIVITD